MRDLRMMRGRSRGRHPGPLLSAFADAALSGRQLRQVTAHLAGCAVCRHELSRLRAAKQLVAGLGEIGPPPGWGARMAAVPARQVSARVPRRGVRRRAVRRLAVALTAVFVLLFAGAMLAPQPEVPLDYQHLVRSHLVQVGEPSTDQGSYIVTVDHP